MNTSVVGLDIAKHVFHVYTILADGKVCKKMLRRKQVLTFFANYLSSLIGLCQLELLGERADCVRT